MWLNQLIDLLFSNALKELILSILLIFGLAGCSAEYWTGRIEPVTQVKSSAWGVEFKDTKQNDIKITDLEVDPSIKKVSAAEIIVANHSAEVIQADAERMDKVKEVMQIQVDYQRQLGMNLMMALQAGGGAASQFLRALPQLDLDFQSPIFSGAASLQPTTNPAPPPNE